MLAVPDLIMLRSVVRFHLAPRKPQVTGHILAGQSRSERSILRALEVMRIYVPDQVFSGIQHSHGRNAPHLHHRRPRCAAAIASCVRTRQRGSLAA